MAGTVTGYLKINKPRGMTSHDVVNRVRRLYGLKKVGHTGTLDPDADGLMILCLGGATRCIQFLDTADKTYIAEILFGTATDTYDVSGEVIRREACAFSREEYSRVLDTFVGDIDQKPPIYSALKKNGLKYYEYARRGIPLEIPSRPVHIYSLEERDSAGLPERALFEVHCSKGTYIRSLCHDIGLALGTAACMGNLTRTTCGRERLSEAVTLEELEAMDLQQRCLCLHPIDEALEDLTKVTSNERGDRFIANGNVLYQWNADEDFDRFSDGQRTRIYDSKGHFIGVGQFIRDLTDDPYVKPLKILT